MSKTQKTKMLHIDIYDLCDRIRGAEDKLPSTYRTKCRKSLAPMIGGTISTDVNGVGVLVKIGDRYFIKALVSCGSCWRAKKNNPRKKINTLTVFLRDGWTTGDLAYVYNRDGKYVANQRDELFICKTHRK